MNAVVFLGPSLSEREARALFDGRILPPARMGDIYNVVTAEKPDVIGLVDGYFDSVPAVWHKEILFAIARGVHVVGASSMGALRAAELHPFGMEGIGQVFESFRSGELEDDDEVAVAHGAADTEYRNVSDAMVNIRGGLARARDRGLISQSTREALVALAKKGFYPERTWSGVLRDGSAGGLPPEELSALGAFVKDERPNLKKEDACALLARLRACAEPRPAAGPADFCPTVFWEKLTKTERRGAAGGGELRDEELRRFVKATDPALPALQREALLAHLVACEVDALGLEVTQAEFDAAVNDFRLRRGLASAHAMQTWLERAGLSLGEFRALMHAEAQCAALLAIRRSETDARLLDALSRAGRLGETTRLAARAPGSSATGRPPSEVLEAFYRAHVRQFKGALTSHARDLGFGSADELLDEVWKIYQPDLDSRAPSGPVHPNH